jgi:cobalamin biosynthesis Mg chelatase CobN
MDTDARIAAALERIATALERPTVLPIYRRHIENGQVEQLLEQLKELGTNVVPVFISTHTEGTQPNGATPQLMGILS